jgi:hypothetical protein
MMRKRKGVEKMDPIKKTDQLDDATLQEQRFPLQEGGLEPVAFKPERPAGEVYAEQGMEKAPGIPAPLLLP